MFGRTGYLSVDFCLDFVLRTDIVLWSRTSRHHNSAFCEPKSCVWRGTVCSGPIPHEQTPCAWDQFHLGHVPGLPAKWLLILGGDTQWERPEMPLAGPPLEGGITQPLACSPLWAPHWIWKNSKLLSPGSGERGPWEVRARRYTGDNRHWDDRKSQGPSSFFLYMFYGRHRHHSLCNTGLEILTGFLSMDVFKAHLLLGPDSPLSALLPSDAHAVFWFKTETAWWNFFLKGKLLHMYISYFSLPQGEPQMCVVSN